MANIRCNVFKCIFNKHPKSIPDDKFGICNRGGVIIDDGKCVNCRFDDFRLGEDENKEIKYSGKCDLDVKFEEVK